MEFSLERLIMLFKRDFKMAWKQYLTILSIVPVLETLFGSKNDFSSSLYMVWFSMIAFIAFRDYIQFPKLKYQAILLPASNLEKFTFNFIISFLILPLLALISILLYVIMLSRYDIFISNIPTLLQAYINYFPLISIMFFGNIFFNKLGGFKIFFLMLGIGFLIVLLNSLVYFVITGDFRYNFTLNIGDLSTNFKYIFFSLFSAFFLWLSYLRLTEKEG